MVEGLIHGVAQALRTRYSEEAYQVYTEAIPQGMALPAFWIGLKNQVFYPGLGRRFREEDQLEIMYIPKPSSASNAECRAVAATLEELLTWVEATDGLVRGRGFKSQLENGKLYFEATYRFDCYRTPDPDELMQEVTIYGKTQANRDA